MTTEREQISKTYYKTIIDENEQGHPTKILGEMYIEEMQKQRPQLSFIRYAQGEVYFLNHDYEAAIFKWQQPLEEAFIPWAQKNIADAHLEMGLLEDAEKIYRQVETSSLALKSEVLLQLFSLYLQQDNQGRAVRTIKEAVGLNPDYSRVTEIARTYLEEINDWDNAVELAVGEAIRTQSLSWFDVLSGYVAKGLTIDYEPTYFNDMLKALLHIDYDQFERFTDELWNSYKQSDFYLEWLGVVNQLLSDHHVESPYVWCKLPTLYQSAYFDLISGRFLIKDISDLVKNHLTNWLNVTSESDALISSTAILAWNETFPTMLDDALVSEAEHQFENANPNQNGRKDGIRLLESIKAWAEKEGLLESLNEIIDPMLETGDIKAMRPLRIRELIKTSIEFLLEQRVVLQEGIQEDVNWNEALLANLDDTHNQIGDMENELAGIMTDSFRDVKNSVTQHVLSELPKRLQSCSEFVQEDSNFANIQVELNEEMNRCIADYMKNYVHNDLKQTIQQWLEDCKSSFQEKQTTCNALSETINKQLNEETVVLQGDFKVLDDWQRDLERISHGLLRIEKANVLLRNTSSQLLLKGADKLLGSIAKKEMLYSRYKNYIENKDFNETVKDMISPFMQQLELIEGSIEWDVNRFFSNPLDVLNRETEKVQLDIERHEHALEKMHDKPEIYRDPLTLFELRLRQYELMNTIG